jgi:hypothetical protein
VRIRARLGTLPLAVAALLIPLSCGDEDSSSSLVDPERNPPINALGVDAAGDVLLTTNRGFFRIRNGEAKRIPAQVSTPNGRGEIGTFLAFTALGDGELLGSGHPDQRGKLASFLGLIRSEDGGRHWRTVSRYGFTDLHVLRVAHGRLYAYDAVLGGLLVSEDDGRTWRESLVPSGPVADLVVSPADGDELLLSFEDRIMSSSDRGRSWQPLVGAERPRMAWPSAEILYRADRNGRVMESEDGGASWSLIGVLDGEPWKLEAIDSEHLVAALRDATIMESRDGGRTWEELFSP